jgi:hypothetical protein
MYENNILLLVGIQLKFFKHNIFNTFDIHNLNSVVNKIVLAVNRVYFCFNKLYNHTVNDFL